jgi:hypothetical protein
LPELCNALAAEGAQFLAQSWQAWTEAQAAALSSTTPLEMMQAQSDHAITSLARYAQCATRCATLISGAAGAAAPFFPAPFFPGPLRRGYDDVPL